MKLLMLQGSESSYFHSSSPLPAAHSLAHFRPQVGWRQGHCCPEGASPALWVLGGDVAGATRELSAMIPPNMPLPYGLHCTLRRCCSDGPCYLGTGPYLLTGNSQKTTLN